MSKNPLLPPSDDAKNPAVELIRAKVSRAYGEEPDAVQELAEVKQERTLSKHQHFMQQLSASGKSLAEIQTAWHHYYVNLPDGEKHEVWQEFYAANQNTPYQKLFKQGQAAENAQEVEGRQASLPAANENGVVVADHSPTPVANAPRKSG